MVPKKLKKNVVIDNTVVMITLCNFLYGSLRELGAMFLKFGTSGLLIKTDKILGHIRFCIGKKIT